MREVTNMKEAYRDFIGSMEAEIGRATEEIQFFESEIESDYDAWDQSDYEEYQSWCNHKAHYESVLKWWTDQCKEFRWTRAEVQEVLDETKKLYAEYSIITEHMMNCGIADMHHDAWDELEGTRYVVRKKLIAVEEFSDFLENGQLV